MRSGARKARNEVSYDAGGIKDFEKRYRRGVLHGEQYIYTQPSILDRPFSWRTVFLNQPRYTLVHRQRMLFRALRGSWKRLNCYQCVIYHYRSCRACERSPTKKRNAINYGTRSGKLLSRGRNVRFLNGNYKLQKRENI